MSVPFTQLVRPISKRQPAPPQEPIQRKRTRLKILARSLLDAHDRHARSLTSDSSGGRGLWEQGSYAELQTCLDRLRTKPGHRLRGLCDCFWAIYVIGSARHHSRRKPKAELVLDWLERQPELEDVYLPAEIAQAYDRSLTEGMAKKWTRPVKAANLPNAFRGRLRPKTSNEAQSPKATAEDRTPQAEAGK